MSDNKEFVQRLFQYLKRFKKEEPTIYHHLDKGALLRTDKNNYYVKFDTMYWVLAGKETGKFTGAGWALNTKFYNIVHELKTDILYTNRPNTVYHYLYNNYENNSFYHTQEYNSERVRVISISDADDVWKI